MESASRPDTPRRHRVSVVIPAKNEALNIGWVLSRLPPSVDEVVLVDGLSSDATVTVAQAIWPGIVVVDERRPGKGAALRAGFDVATGDYIVMLDADGSMDPQEMGRFIELLDNGHDLVKGSRFLQGGGTADMSVLRETGNRCLLAIANLLFGTGHTDLCYGYAAFRRHAILALEVTADGFEVETELFLRATRNGLTVGEVPSFEAPRRTGASNLHTFRDGSCARSSPSAAVPSDPPQRCPPAPWRSSSSRKWPSLNPSRSAGRASGARRSTKARSSGMMSSGKPLPVWD